MRPAVARRATRPIERGDTSWRMRIAGQEPGRAHLKLQLSAARSCLGMRTSCFTVLCLVASGVLSEACGTSERAAPEPPVTPTRAERPDNEVDAGVDAGADAGVDAGVDPDEPQQRAEPDAVTVFTDGAPQPTLERALSDVDGAVTLLAQRRVDASLYVLFTQTLESLEAARGDIAEDDVTDEDDEGACDDADSFALWDCVAQHANSEMQALRRFEPSLRRIGLARIEGHAGQYRAVAMRTLFAFASLPEDTPPRLLASDLDGDGAVELAATIELILPRDDSNMGGMTTARVVFVLDLDLHQALGVGTALDDANVDVGGSTLHCVTALSYADTNQDAHPDVHLEERCTTTFVDEEVGASSRRRTSAAHDCLYLPDVDRWSCPEIENDIVRGAGTSLVSARGLLHPLSASSDASNAGLAVTAPARPCRLIVDDPAPPLRVRARPSVRADIVTELANGTVLELHERSGRFARIEAPASGWVWTENLREVCE